MAGETKREDSLESFIEDLRAVATQHFATEEVDVPVLHFLREGAIGVAPLVPLPDLDSSTMARLIVGAYDPPVAAVLAEGWATNLALPREVDEALAGKRPWHEVSERVHKRLARALPGNPALAEALRRGDVEALGTKHRHALIYAWHDATMGPVVRGEKSLKDLPPHMRRKILTIFGEDRQGHSQTLLWRIEQRGGRRHFVPESLVGAEQYTSRWRPLYLALEMAARTGLPMTLVRPRMRDLCREQLRPYKIVEGITFTDRGSLFMAPMPPDVQ